MITGMEQPIEPPPLRKRKWGVFTDIAEELVIEQRGRIVAPGEDTPLPAGIQSSSVPRGVTFTPYGCDPLTVIESEFCDDTPAEDDASGGSLPVFEAFTVRASESCSALDVDAAWLNGRIATRWDAWISAALVGELANGAHSGASPTLQNSAEVLIPAPLDPTEALGAVDALLGTKIGNAEGFIFVNPGLLPQVSPSLIVDGGQWRTPTGHIIISDAGFFGAAPDAGESDPTVSWIYGTGHVGYKVGPPRLNSPNAVEYLDRTRNIVHGRKLADAVLAFDPCSVVAVGANAFSS